MIMHPLQLARRGEISARDAAVILAVTPPHEVVEALRLAAVHELRDRVLRGLQEELNRRFNDRPETQAD